MSPDFWYTYAITNSHIALNFPVIRVNVRTGGIEVIELNADNWTLHPESDDLAAYGIDLDDHHDYVFIPNDDLFLTRDIIDKYNIGPGDDTFMIGRFVNHEGRQKNLPSIRFGNIAQMPYESIRLSSGIEQEAFLVETRSLGGYSGAPVFVQIPPLSDRQNSNRRDFAPLGPWLLGIDCGHLPLVEYVEDKESHRHPDGWRVIANSGMMIVIPSWRLQILLESEEFIVQRQTEDSKLIEDKEKLTPFMEGKRSRGVSRPGRVSQSISAILMNH